MNNQFLMLTAFMFAMPYTMAHASNNSDVHQKTSLRAQQKSSTPELSSELIETIKINTHRYLSMMEEIRNLELHGHSVLQYSDYNAVIEDHTLIPKYKKTASELLHTTSQQATILLALQVQASQSRSTSPNLSISANSKVSADK